MEVSCDFINDELLEGVDTKWMMTTFRHREKMNPFADGYLFGIVDVVYKEGRFNEATKTLLFPQNWHNLKKSPRKQFDWVSWDFYTKAGSKLQF